MTVRNRATEWIPALVVFALGSTLLSWLSYRILSDFPDRNTTQAADEHRRVNSCAA